MQNLHLASVSFQVHITQMFKVVVKLVMFVMWASLDVYCFVELTVEGIFLFCRIPDPDAVKPADW